jgi:hypothetical protein
MATQHERSNSKVKIKRSRIQMTWSMVPADYMRDVINDVTLAGCAIVMGRTLNGSALSVCILAGNDKVRDYIGSMDDIEPVIDGLLDDLQIDRLTDFTKGQEPA